jgi:hypothetical protein
VTALYVQACRLLQVQEHGDIRALIPIIGQPNTATNSAPSFIASGGLQPSFGRSDSGPRVPPSYRLLHMLERTQGRTFTKAEESSLLARAMSVAYAVDILAICRILLEIRMPVGAPTHATINIADASNAEGCVTQRQGISCALVLREYSDQLYRGSTALAMKVDIAGLAWMDLLEFARYRATDYMTMKIARARYWDLLDPTVGMTLPNGMGGEDGRGDGNQWTNTTVRQGNGRRQSLHQAAAYAALQNINHMKWLVHSYLHCLLMIELRVCKRTPAGAILWFTTMTAAAVTKQRGAVTDSIPSKRQSLGYTYTLSPQPHRPDVASRSPVITTTRDATRSPRFAVAGGKLPRKKAQNSTGAAGIGSPSGFTTEEVLNKPIVSLPWQPSAPTAAPVEATVAPSIAVEAHVPTRPSVAIPSIDAVAPSTPQRFLTLPSSTTTAMKIDISMEESSTKLPVVEPWSPGGRSTSTTHNNMLSLLAEVDRDIATTLLNPPTHSRSSRTGILGVSTPSPSRTPTRGMDAGMGSNMTPAIVLSNSPAFPFPSVAGPTTATTSMSSHEPGLFDLGVAAVALRDGSEHLRGAIVDDVYGLTRDRDRDRDTTIITTNKPLSVYYEETLAALPANLFVSSSVQLYQPGAYQRERELGIVYKPVTPAKPKVTAALTSPTSKSTKLPQWSLRRTPTPATDERVATPIPPPSFIPAAPVATVPTFAIPAAVPVPSLTQPAPVVRFKDDKEDEVRVATPLPSPLPSPDEPSYSHTYTYNHEEDDGDDYDKYDEVRLATSAI